MKLELFCNACNYNFFQIPGPERGEIVRQMGDALRKKKNLLGKMVFNTFTWDTASWHVQLKCFYVNEYTSKREHSKLKGVADISKRR